MRHPNIVETLGFEYAKSHLYIYLEYVQRPRPSEAPQTSGETVRGGPFTSGEQTPFAPL